MASSNLPISIKAFPLLLNATADIGCPVESLHRMLVWLPRIFPSIPFVVKCSHIVVQCGYIVCLLDFVHSSHVHQIDFFAALHAGCGSRALSCSSMAPLSSPCLKSPWGLVVVNH